MSRMPVHQLLSIMALFSRSVGCSCLLEGCELNLRKNGSSVLRTTVALELMDFDWNLGKSVSRLLNNDQRGSRDIAGALLVGKSSGAVLLLVSEA